MWKKLAMGTATLLCVAMPAEAGCGCHHHMHTRMREASVLDQILANQAAILENQQQAAATPPAPPMVVQKRDAPNCSTLVNTGTISCSQYNFAGPHWQDEGWKYQQGQFAPPFTLQEFQTRCVLVMPPERSAMLWANYAQVYDTYTLRRIRNNWEQMNYPHACAIANDPETRWTLFPG